MTSPWQRDINGACAHRH